MQKISSQYSLSLPRNR